MKVVFKMAVFVAAILLSGCKTELYSGLSENDANQMITVLAHENIKTEKKTDPTGTLSLLVEKDDFVDAVEILKHNGYPHRQQKNIEDLFPSGQLVSSPVQEQSKIDFLKEQGIEKMLSAVDGVISANVAIASALHDESGRQSAPPSAAVFIKYADRVDLPALQNQLRGLIHNAVPGVSWDNISLVLQPVERPLTASSEHPEEPSETAKNFLGKNKNSSLILWAFVGVLWLAFVVYTVFILIRQYKTRRREKKFEASEIELAKSKGQVDDKP